MPEQDDFSNMEIVIRDNSSVPAPTGKNLGEWTSDRLAKDAPKLYKALNDGLLESLKVRVDEDGKVSPPSVAVMKLAADVLRLTQQAGISINQNFGGNTTITNNNAGMSFEDIVKMQEMRRRAESEARVEAEIIDAEIVEDKPKSC